jgi:hypothetical protein
MGGTRKLASSGIVAGAFAALMALAHPGPASSQAAVASVSITPASQSATVGETVTVTVSVKDATNLAAYDVMIQYDTGVLEFVDRRDLGFIETSGRAVTCPSPVVDDEFDLGTVLAGCASSGLEPPGASGDADLMEFTFKAAAGGTSELVFLRVNLADPNGDSCCGDFYFNEDEGEEPETPPSGDMIISEAAVAVGRTSDPPLPDQPEPSVERRTKTVPTNGQLPAYETLPESSGGTTSGSSGQSGSSGGSTPGGQNSRSSAGVQGSSSSGGSGSDDFPSAGHGPADEPESPWVLSLAYGLAGVGLALAAGTAGFEEWRRRRSRRI